MADAMDQLEMRIAAMKQQKTIEFAKTNPESTIMGGWIEFGMYSITIHVFDWSDQREVLTQGKQSFFFADLVALRQKLIYHI